MVTLSQPLVSIRAMLSTKIAMRNRFRLWVKIQDPFPSSEQKSSTECAHPEKEEEQTTVKYSPVATMTRRIATFMDGL
jgi:hypothetical protein